MKASVIAEDATVDEHLQLSGLHTRCVYVFLFVLVPYTYHVYTYWTSNVDMCTPSEINRAIIIIISSQKPLYGHTWVVVKKWNSYLQDTYRLPTPR